MSPPRSFLHGFACTAALLVQFRFLDARTFIGFCAGLVAGISWCHLRRGPTETKAVKDDPRAQPRESTAGQSPLPLERSLSGVLRGLSGDGPEGRADQDQEAGVLPPAQTTVPAQPAGASQSQPLPVANNAAAGAGLGKAQPSTSASSSAARPSQPSASSSSTLAPVPELRDVAPILRSSGSLVPGHGRAVAHGGTVPCFDMNAFWSLFAPAHKRSSKGSKPSTRQALAGAQQKANDNSREGDSPSRMKGAVLQQMQATHKKKQYIRILQQWAAKHEWCLRSSEGVAWLDQLAEDMWPRISKYVENLVYKSVEPAINAALPSFVKGNVHFTEVSLGNAPPHFGPLCVYTSPDKREIELRLGMKLASDIKATLEAVGLQLGISKIKIEGTVSVVFRPYRERPPFFGGLEVFLINPPLLDLEFHGAGKIAELPTVRPIVRSAIAGVVARKMVLPNRIAVDLDIEDEVDIADLKCPDPHFVLRLGILKATGLAAADANLFSAASSDPYVVVELGATRHQSPVIEKNLNPEWNFFADYPIHDPSQLVNIQVFDQDFYTSDDLIGQAMGLELASFLNETGVVELPLTASLGNEGAGTLTISCKFTEFVAHPCSGGAFLAAKIREVRGLSGDLNYPFKVQVSLGGVEGSSKPSHAPGVRALSDDLQALCTKLLSEGRSREAVAKVLGLDIDDVMRVLNSSTPNDPTLQKALNDALAERAAHNPTFDEVVQLLIPDWQAVPPSSKVHLQLIDKKGVAIDEAHIDTARISDAEGYKLVGPFAFERTGAQLLGSLRLRFYEELPEGSTPSPKSERHLAPAK